MELPETLSLALLVWLVFRAVQRRAQYRQLLSDLAAGVADARERSYRASAVGQLVTLCAAAVCLATDPNRLPFNFERAPFISPPVFLVCFAAAMAFSIRLLRRGGDRQLRFLLRTAGGIIPRSTRERRLFLALTLLIGVSEEVVFRWFLASSCMSLLSLGWWESVVLSSLVFGFAHLYQGPAGVATAAGIGVLLAVLWLSTSTLWVPIVVHVLQNARVPLALTEARLRNLEAQSR